MEQIINSKHWCRNRLSLLEIYNSQQGSYQRILDELIKELRSLISGAVIKGRIKKFNTFYKKLLGRNRPTDESPFASITDLMALRITAPLVEDMSAIETRIREEFEVVEMGYKSHTLSLREFGYGSTHMLILVPHQILSSCGETAQRMVEVQLRTHLQDDWAEVKHEQVYKTSIKRIDTRVRRKLAGLNATLTLAAVIIQEIQDHQSRKYRDLSERQQKLLNKIATLPNKVRLPRSNPKGRRQALQDIISKV